MERFVEKILTPWAARQEEELNLPPDQKALIILDVYAAHRTPAVLKCFENAGWLMQFVPGNCTEELQPLDVSVNAVLKASLKDEFTKWYAKCVQDAMAEHPDNMRAAVESVRPDLRLSVVKPIHARWVMDAFSTLKTKPGIVFQGFEKAGIVGAVAAATGAAIATHVAADAASAAESGQ